MPDKRAWSKTRLAKKVRRPLANVMPFESGRARGTEECRGDTSTPGVAPLFPDIRSRRQGRPSLSDSSRRVV